jgi:hypothetical protein
VSWSPAATGRGISQENPPMRVYVIGNDGITLCREPLATVNEGEIAVTSKEGLQAAPLSGKQLLALWNALPAVEKRKNDRYPFSPRICTLRGMLTMLRPQPVREPLPPPKGVCAAASQ